MVKNWLRLDPTRTGLIRRAFVGQVEKRFSKLRGAVWDLVVRKDVFGLVEPKPPTILFDPDQPRASAGTPEGGQWVGEGITHNLLINAPGHKAFQFTTDDAKLHAFNVWFKVQVDDGVLEVTRTTRPWLSKFVESAYKKGAIRAYMDSHVELGKPQEYYLGSREQFLRSTFDTPERVSKLRLLGTRAFEELKGITSDMSGRISRVLADGLANGKGPYEIARTMSKTITGIQRKRANVLARTEIIHAHAEGQLDAFEDLGVEEVGMDVEWSTTEDELVCPECEEYSGEVMKVEKARGLIPLHPNCRCAWIPYLKKRRQVA